MYPISAVAEPADSIVWSDDGESGRHRIVQYRQSARLDGPQQLFDL